MSVTPLYMSSMKLVILLHFISWKKILQTMLWHHNARVNSHQSWKQTRFCVCFHLWCELNSTMNVTEWQVSWNSWIVLIERQTGYNMKWAKTSAVPRRKTKRADGSVLKWAIKHYNDIQILTGGDYNMDFSRSYIIHIAKPPVSICFITWLEKFHDNQ